jgi:dTDP-D-glucose 4,6-dehydratase
MIMNRLGWAPGTRLCDGMEKTYQWIEKEFVARQQAESHQVSTTTAPV